MFNIIDKIFNRFHKYQAPSGLSERILRMNEEVNAKQTSTPKTSRQNKISLNNWLVWLKPVMALVLVAVLVGGVYFQFFRVGKLAAAFELKPEIMDDAGVPANGAFILKANKFVTSAQLKQVIKIEPEVDFELKSLGNNTFKISPKTELKGYGVYKISIPEGLGDRNYSWAYQIKARFSVTGSNPGDKGTYVPVDSGIEVIFNRENIQDIEKYFEITPEVKGRFEVKGDTAVFIPKSSLRANQVYQVKIKAGLGALGVTDSLEKDYQFSFETTQTGSGITGGMGVQNDFDVQLPNTKPTVALYAYNYNFQTDLKQVRLYRFNNSEEFINSYAGSRNWDWGWTAFYRNNGITPEVGKLLKLSEFKPEVKTIGYQTFFELPETLEQGNYLVEIVASEGNKYVWLQITSISQYFSLTNENGLMWVKDFVNKNSVGSAKLSLWQESGNKNLANANNQGLIEFVTPEVLKVGTNIVQPVFFKVESRNSPDLFVIAKDNWGVYGPSKGDLYWKYITTDRPVYQMTDEINYWGVIKARGEDLRGKKISIALYSGYRYYGEEIPSDDQPLVAEQVEVSNFDTYQGKLNLKGLQTGYYSLVVLNGTEIVTSTSVQVATYLKPLYGLTIQPNKSQIFAGEPVIFKVKASFFDGTSVTGMKLSYSAYWNTQIQGEVVLDSQGEGNITLIPEYKEADNEDYYNYYPRSLDITVKPANVEEGEIQASGNVSVFGPKMHLQAYQEKNQGEDYNFVVKLNNIDLNNKSSDGSYYQSEFIGSPVNGYRLEAKIIRIYYEKVETGEAFDSIYKKVYKTYRYDKKEEVIESFNGLTDSLGEWRINKKLPAKVDSIYKVQVNGKDGSGRSLRSTIYAYPAYYYSGFDNYNPNNPFSIELRVDNPNETNYYFGKDYSVGDTVKLNLSANEGQLENSTEILYYRYQNKIGRVQVTASKDFSEGFTEDFAPNVQYRAVVLGPYGFVESNTVNASLKLSDKELKIKTETNQSNYRPGDEVSLKYNIQDKNKRGVTAEVNVAVVDEAIFQIPGYNFQANILDGLYQGIYINPIVGYTLYNSGRLSQGGAEKGGCFAGGTQILLANGKSKSIEAIRIGDEILTRESERSGRLVKAVVQGTSSHFVDGYLVVNNTLKITPEHTVYAGGEWKAMAQVRLGETMLDVSGNSVVVNTVEYQPQAKTLVYNLTVNKYHTYFAGNLYVHNQAKGGSVERVNFKDTALFQSFRTNENGSGELKFKLPDNITSWRVTSQAYAPAGMLAGHNQTNINAGLPFFVDAVTNSTYLAGDKPIMKVRVFGSAFKNGEEVEYSLRSNELKLNLTKQSKNRELEIPLGELKPGIIELHIRAKQGKHEDALVKKFEVIQSYFKRSASETQSVNTGRLSVKLNPSGQTQLVFADSGKGKYYSDLKNLLYGGIRMDEQAAALAANKLLTKYFEEDNGLQLNLNNYVRESGGLGLLAYGDPDLLASAKAADLVAENLSQNTLAEYFTRSLSDDKADIHRTAIALYGLASLKYPVLNKLQNLSESSELNKTDKLYIAVGLAKFGDLEGARKIYYETLRPNLEFNGLEASVGFEKDLTKKIKLTGSLAELAGQLEIYDDSQKLFRYTLNHYPVNDLAHMEKALAIRELLKQTKNQSASLEYMLNGKTEKVDLSKGQTKLLVVTPENFTNLEILSVSGDVRVTSYFEVSEEPNNLAKQSNLEINRRYLVDGKETNEFKAGDLVQVELTPKLRSGALEGEYFIKDFLPAGTRLVTNTFNLTNYLEGKTDCNYFWTPAMVINQTIYFDYYLYERMGGSCNQGSINYFARVVSLGEFTAEPPVMQFGLDLKYANIGKETRIIIK